MSRSRKKAIYKDKGHRKKDYWRVHRRVNNQILKRNLRSSYKEIYEAPVIPEIDGYYEAIVSYQNSRECYEIYLENLNVVDSLDLEHNLKLPKELINDYDYSDYTSDCEFRQISEDTETDNEWRKKFRRK